MSENTGVCTDLDFETINTHKHDFIFNLGDEVCDKITEYKGIVYVRSQWLTNCNTYGVKSKQLKDDKPLDMVYFDEPSIRLLQEKTMESPIQKSGGPCIFIPQTNR